MPGRLPENIQQKLSDRLRYYQDIGIREFFRDRVGAVLENIQVEVATTYVAVPRSL